MLFVIPHIIKDSKYHSDIDHRKHVNNVFNTLFHGLYVVKMAVTQELFWTEYTLFDNNNVSIDGDEFICKSKDIRYGNSHSLPCTKVLCFVVCRFTSNFLGVGAAERSWGDVKTIKFGKYIL